MKQMNLEVQPILTILVNVIVGCLVSRGIIDSTSQPQISQEVNNVLAALVTLGLGIYSTHKVMDAYKHKITTNAQVASGISIPSVTTSASTFPSETTITINGQTGLPLTPASA